MNNPLDIYDDDFDFIHKFKVKFRRCIVQAEINRGHNLYLPDFNDIGRSLINYYDPLYNKIKPVIKKEFFYYSNKLFEYEQCF